MKSFGSILQTLILVFVLLIFRKGFYKMSCYKKVLNVLLLPFIRSFIRVSGKNEIKQLKLQSQREQMVDTFIKSYTFFSAVLLLKQIVIDGLFNNYNLQLFLKQYHKIVG